jgi:starch phosphorylase
VERHYEPAAAAYRDRSAAKGEKGRRIAEWLRAIETDWPDLHFGPARVETRAGQHRFEMLLHLGRLDPGSVRVELYAEAPDGGTPERHPGTGARR